MNTQKRHYMGIENLDLLIRLGAFSEGGDARINVTRACVSNELSLAGTGASQTDSRK